jgi:hypothetical protein
MQTEIKERKSEKKEEKRRKKNNSTFNILQERENKGLFLWQRKKGIIIICFNCLKTSFYHQTIFIVTHIKP